jgi:hypothetical protein
MVHGLAEGALATARRTANNNSPRRHTIALPSQIGSPEYKHYDDQCYSQTCCNRRSGSKICQCGSNYLVPFCNCVVSMTFCRTRSTHIRLRLQNPTGHDLRRHPKMMSWKAQLSQGVLSIAIVNTARQYRFAFFRAIQTNTKRKWFVLFARNRALVAAITRRSAFCKCFAIR